MVRLRLMKKMKDSSEQEKKVGFHSSAGMVAQTIATYL